MGDSGRHEYALSRHRLRLPPASRRHQRSSALSAAIGQYVGDDLGLLRNRLRVLDAGTGDGRVLKGAVERLLRVHCHRPCEMVLKEYDFHHIEALLQTVAPLLHHYPGLTLYVTNRTFRQLRDFHHDVGPENTVCFDSIAGYRLLAMAGTASLLKQENSLCFSFPNLTRPISDGEAILSIAPLDDLWGGERALYSDHFLPAAPPALKALGDEIRAREIYDELAAARGASKQFTVTVTRQKNGVDIAEPRDCFWDLAIVSHAFNRDKDPGWICRNILSPLCQRLSIGGVLVNVTQSMAHKSASFDARFSAMNFLFVLRRPSLPMAWRRLWILSSSRFYPAAN